MLKNKLLILSIILGFSGLTPVNAQLTLKDMNIPKPPAYRVGISSVPENQYIQAQEENSKIEDITKLDDIENGNFADVSYADLSIKRLSREVSKELTYEEQNMVSDLSLLWQGAATQSDTINFALYKLANPDADKPDKQSLKKVLSTIASMSTLVGASMASPVMAGSSLIGSNILGIMSQDTKALNYKYTKVTDADMIILIRKVEDLQQNAVDLYYDYMSARKQVDMINKLVEERQKKFSLAQSNNAARELIVITDAYYRSALDKQRGARSNFLSKRAALEQFVGNEAFTQFEKELYERENQNSETSSSSETLKQQNTAYNETIENVANYTNNLQLRGIEETSQYESNSYYNSYDSSNDPNLKMLPDLQPLYETPTQTIAETPKTEVKQTTEASNVKTKKTSKKNLNEKSNNVETSVSSSISDMQETLPEAKNNKKKEKEDKYSTKGIIFLHGMTKDQAKNSQQNTNSTQTTIQTSTPVSTKLTPQQQMNKDFNLLPLDDILPPRNGHSIYEELTY